MSFGKNKRWKLHKLQMKRGRKTTYYIRMHACMHACLSSGDDASISLQLPCSQVIIHTGASCRSCCSRVHCFMSLISVIKFWNQSEWGLRKWKSDEKTEAELTPFVEWVRSRQGDGRMHPLEVDHETVFHTPYLVHFLVSTGMGLHDVLPSTSCFIHSLISIPYLLRLSSKLTPSSSLHFFIWFNIYVYIHRSLLGSRDFVLSNCKLIKQLLLGNDCCSAKLPRTTMHGYIYI